MQFADLMRLFREGQNEGRKRDYVSQGACDAEGVRFVVRALRDEMDRQRGDDWRWGDTVYFFNSILGDAGEKVTEDPLPHLSEREKALFVAALKGGAGPTTPPATDPAPACEWRVGKDPAGYSCYYSDCTTGWRGLRANFCPTCEHPVKIVETNPAPAERSDATAVCEWRAVHSSFGQSFFASKCGKAHDNIGGGICPSCGKPIKFTEAKT